MMRATENKGKNKPENSRVKHAGICDAAKQLGVERTHLYRVLKGERVSKRLMQRYAELTKEEAKL
jgi:hypothetical protein